MTVASSPALAFTSDLQVRRSHWSFRGCRVHSELKFVLILRPASWLALLSRTFTFELSLTGSPQANVEYDYVGKQSIPTTGLSPASPTALWAAEIGLTPRTHVEKILNRSDPEDPYQGQRGSESLRPRLGTVLRGTSRREDGRDPGGPMDSAAALEGARRHLSGLQPEDHHGDGVAQPPYRVANPWGQGYDREPRAGASELPSTDPQPRVRCGKAASCEGRSRGLSCMKGNFHVQFLGEGVAATSPPYPTPGWVTTQVYPARGPPKSV